jgi:hypothetical protein
MGMSGNQRSPGEHIVNVAIAIHIIKIRTFAAVNEERLPPHGTKGAYRRVHAAREQLLCFLKERWI